jgi:hypothetical protein
MRNRKGQMEWTCFEGAQGYVAGRRNLQAGAQADGQVCLAGRKLGGL